MIDDVRKEIAYRKTLMTRDRLGDHLANNSCGLSPSTLNKLCSPLVNDGPPVADYWLGRPLYDPDAALAWALSRRKPRSNRRWHTAARAGAA
jgi:hypothetical protein